MVTSPGAAIIPRRLESKLRDEDLVCGTIAGRISDTAQLLSSVRILGVASIDVGALRYIAMVL